MKPIKITISILIVLISLQSCKDFFQGAKRNTKVYGTVKDDITGELLDNVKISVKLMDYEVNVPVYEETDEYTYTDENGYYEIKYKNISGINKLIPTRDDYVFVIFNSQYPQIPYGAETEINVEMTKIGPAKCNIITYEINPDNSHDYSNRISDVKITVLRRLKEDNNTIYPVSVDTVKYTNDTGECYIEYWEEKEYHYFLKPEIDGYTYYYGGYDYYILGSYTQGHPKNLALGMRQEK